jgi:apolipoprotein N-acyltransferase
MAQSAQIPWILAALAVLLMCAYLSIYFGIFGVLYVWFGKKSFLWKLFLLPSSWVVLEFLRDRLFSGFGWASLAHSQYKLLPVIQIADITGVFGISFVLVMVNCFLKEIIVFRRDPKKREWKEIFWPAGIVAVFLAVILAYGFGISRRYAIMKRISVKVGIVQGNIAQERKWERGDWPAVFEEYLALTQEAARERPDLLIWPETSFPGYLWELPQTFVELKRFVGKMKIPLLLGAVSEENEEYHNSAILLSSSGEELKRHYKMHLVAFGEFIPFRKFLPWLGDLVPIADFTAGKDLTVFRLPIPAWGNQELRFSVLICFEDTVAGLARSFVKEGADVLVNITNDAWFLDSKEAFFHMQNSVFRAVENRRSLVRVANTGVSCFIDERGKIYRYLQNSSGKKTFVAGYAIENVAWPVRGSFYTKYGDIFTYFCFGCILLGSMVVKDFKKRKGKQGG